MDPTELGEGKDVSYSSSPDITRETNWYEQFALRYVKDLFRGMLAFPFVRTPELEESEDFHPVYRLLCFLKPLYFDSTPIDTFVIRWIQEDRFRHEFDNHIEKALLRYLSCLASDSCLANVCRVFERRFVSQRSTWKKGAPSAIRQEIQMFLDDYFCPLLEHLTGENGTSQVSLQLAKPQPMPSFDDVQHMKELFRQCHQFGIKRREFYEQLNRLVQLSAVLSRLVEPNGCMERIDAIIRSCVERMLDDPSGVQSDLEESLDQGALSGMRHDLHRAWGFAVITSIMKACKDVIAMRKALTQHEFHDAKDYCNDLATVAALILERMGLDIWKRRLVVRQQEIELLLEADDLCAKELLCEGDNNALMRILPSLPELQGEFFRGWIALKGEVLSCIERGDFLGAFRLISHKAKAKHTATDVRYGALLRRLVEQSQDVFEVCLQEARVRIMRDDVDTELICHEVQKLLKRYPDNPKALEMFRYVCISHYKAERIDSVLDLCTFVLRVSPQPVTWAKRMFFYGMAKCAYRRVLRMFKIVNVVREVTNHKRDIDIKAHRVQLGFSRILLNEENQEITLSGFDSGADVTEWFPKGSACVLMVAQKVMAEEMNLREVKTIEGKTEEGLVTYMDPYPFTVKRIEDGSRVVLCGRDACELYESTLRIRSPEPRGHEGRGALLDLLLSHLESHVDIQGTEEHFIDRKRVWLPSMVVTSGKVRLKKKYYVPEEQQARDLQEFLHSLHTTIPNADQLESLCENGDGRVQVCFVDEAGRATVPESLLPLRILGVGGNSILGGSEVA